MRLEEVKIGRKRRPARGSGLVALDVMTADPLAVRSDDHLLDAVARMQQAAVRHLPVVDGENKVLGLLSDRDARLAVGDLLSAETEEETRVRTATLRVSAAMRRDAVIVSPDETLVEVARRIVEAHEGAALVADVDGRMMGIVSYEDVIRGFLRS